MDSDINIEKYNTTTHEVFKSTAPFGKAEVQATSKRNIEDNKRIFARNAPKSNIKKNRKATILTNEVLIVSSRGRTRLSSWFWGKC